MEKVAVLTSGGVDSSILLVDMAKRSRAFPLYLRVGMAWEDQEQRALEAFIAAVGEPNMQPVTVLTLPIEPFYGDHWGVRGVGAPKAGTAESGLFLPGRNVLLLSLAAVWCATHDVALIAIGSLAGNPFPDATPEFFESFGRVLSSGLAHEVRIVAPFRETEKHDLIRRYGHLPLHLSLTCMEPRGDGHCGECLKCEERQTAFAQAGVGDLTPYGAAKQGG